MSRPALNLLRQVQAAPWTGLWPAALCGAWLGGAIGLTCQWQLPALAQAEAERQRLTAAQAQQARQASAQRRARAQQEAAQRAAQNRWQQQQDWHAALSALAQAHGLRVQSWQGDAQQLQLQAWLPQARDVSEVLLALNATGPSPWRLQSLRQNAEPGVWLNLQAQLPAPASRTASETVASGAGEGRP